MKNKLLIVFAVCFLFLLFIAGCGKNQKSPEKIIEGLKNLDSYSCDMDMKIQNDKQVINYKGTQFYDKKAGYRFELEKNRIMIYKKNKIFIKDLKNGLKYDTDKDFDSVFKLSFIGEYIGLIYTNEKIKTSLKNINNEQYQIIHLDIPGNNKNITRCDLYINVKNEIPKYLIIYDSKNREKIKIDYSNFKCNPELKEELFNIE